MDAKIISSDVLGIDIVTTLVDGKVYVINPPTIRILSLIGEMLGELGEGQDIGIILSSCDKDNLARALSCLIQGDDKLYDTLMKGSDDELTEGIVKALGFVEIKAAASMASTAKNINNLIARPYK